MPPAKRRKGVHEDDVKNLRKLLHCGGVTMTGLAELLGSLRSNPVGDVTGTVWYLREANRAEFNVLRRTIVLPRAGGGTVNWELADPNKLLARAIDISPSLSSLYAAALQTFPCRQERPWRLVIGFDEFMPGWVVLWTLHKRHTRSHCREFAAIAAVHPLTHVCLRV